MTPPEAMAAIRLALGPAWVVHHHAMTGEFSARRGHFAVFGRSPGEVVDRAAQLVVERVRASEPLRVPVTDPPGVAVIPTNVVRS